MLDERRFWHALRDIIAPELLCFIVERLTRRSSLDAFVERAARPINIVDVTGVFRIESSEITGLPVDIGMRSVKLILQPAKPCFVIREA